MNKFTKVMNKMANKAGKNSPAILIGLGITSAAGAVIFAIKGTIAANKKVKEVKEAKINELMEEEVEDIPVEVELTKKEIVQATWKYYIPTAISFTTSVVCIICANNVNAKRNAAIATAYSMSEAALHEYKNKVIETIGEEKEKEIAKAVVKDKIEKAPAPNTQVIVAGDGEQLCLDYISQRYFKSDRETLRAAVNDLNEILNSCDYVSLNDFYDKIGLERTSIGDEIGWNVSRDGLIQLDITGDIAKDGRPCLGIGYRVAPRYEYSMYH